MTRNDALHGGEPDPGPLESLGKVQPLKHAKQIVDVLHIEAHTVVPREDDHFARVTGLTAYLDPRLFARARELDGVRNQVGQGEIQHRPVTRNSRQRGDLPLDAAPDGIALGFAEYFTCQRLERDERVLLL